MNKLKTKLKEVTDKISVENNKFTKKTKSLYGERDRLQSEIINKENSRLIGKYFRYRNAFGSGEKWWLYYKVVDIAEHGYLKVLFFEEDSRKELNLGVKEVSKQMIVDYSKPIPEYKFEEEYKIAIKKVQKAFRFKVKDEISKSKKSQKKGRKNN